MPTVQELLENVNVGTETTLALARELDKDKIETGTKILTIESRKLLAEEPRDPVRAESKRRAHEFYDIDGFISYVKKYGGDNTVIFGDPARNRCTAVLDEKAEKGHELVVFTPMIHPLWPPWETIVGRRISLDAFVDFISMNRRGIAKPDGRSLTMALSQVRATTSIELHRGRAKDSLNGLLVRTKIQGVDKESIVEIPDLIQVNMPLYVKTSARVIELDLIVETEANGTGIVVGISAGDLMAAKVSAFEEMLGKCDVLTTGEKKMTVTLGAPNYAPWDYLKELPA